VSSPAAPGEVADRLRACLRAGDTPARLGGDEFAVLLAGAGAAETLAVPVRIGAVVATAGETADDLLRRADAAPYAAKRAGKNRVRLTPARRRLAGERPGVSKKPSPARADGRL
jgi:GGDEF domain-containing protein